MNDYHVIGTCSLCGGPVQVPRIWMGVISPVPTCGGCGAQQAAHGPVIQMQPAPRVRTMTGTQFFYEKDKS